MNSRTRDDPKGHRRDQKPDSPGRKRPHEAPFQLLMLLEHRHQQGQARVYFSWIIEKDAPWGSWIMANRPTPSTSFGPKRGLPPRDFAFASEPSQSLTWK